MTVEKTGKVMTRVNLRKMSIWECINYLVQFFTGSCRSYSFRVNNNHLAVLVIVVDCQSGYSCHQQNKQVQEGWLCGKKVKKQLFSKHGVSKTRIVVGWVEGATNRKM